MQNIRPQKPRAHTCVVKNITMPLFRSEFGKIWNQNQNKQTLAQMPYLPIGGRTVDVDEGVEGGACGVVRRAPGVAADPVPREGQHDPVDLLGLWGDGGRWGPAPRDTTQHGATDPFEKRGTQRRVRVGTHRRR